MPSIHLGVGMKGYRSSFFLSILVHLLILSLLFLTQNRRRPAEQLEVVMDRGKSEVPDVPPARETLPPAQKRPVMTEESSGSGESSGELSEETVPEKSFSASEDSRQLQLEAEKRETFMSVRTEDSKKDTSISFLRRSIRTPITPGTSRPRDLAEEEMTRRNQGNRPLILDPGALNTDRKSAKIPSPQFNFMPTLPQIEAMACLYEKGKCTQVDLYSSLTAVPITAEQFDKELERLYRKGFLDREKISPENIFTIQSPFGSIPFEMSRKNRLNPLYLYEPKVDRQQIMTFLQAQLYLLEQKKASDPASPGLTDQIASLKRKILVLLPPED